MDNDYVTRLIINELTGNITPEEKSILNQLIQEDDTILLKIEEIKKKMVGGELNELIENKFNLIHIDHFWAYKRRRKRKRIVSILVVAAFSLMLAHPFILDHLSKLLHQPYHKNKNTAIPTDKRLPYIYSEDVGIFTIQLKDNEEFTLHNSVFKQKGDTLLFISSPIDSTREITLCTATARDYKLLLPDQSCIHMAAGSSYTFSLYPNKSRGGIIKGKALFAVTPDPHKPFNIETPLGNKTEVLGTRVIIETFATDDKVALLDGRVRVSNKKDTLYLSPGYIAYLKEGEKIHSNKFNEEEETAWMKNSFRNVDVTWERFAQLITQCHGYSVELDQSAKSDSTNKFTITVSKDYPLKEMLEDLKKVIAHRKFNYYFDKDSTLHLQ